MRIWLNVDIEHHGHLIIMRVVINAFLNETGIENLVNKWIDIIDYKKFVASYSDRNLGMILIEEFELEKSFYNYLSQNDEIRSIFHQTGKVSVYNRNTDFKSIASTAVAKAFKENTKWDTMKKNINREKRLRV